MSFKEDIYNSLALYGAAMNCDFENFERLYKEITK